MTAGVNTHLSTAWLDVFVVSGRLMRGMEPSPDQVGALGLKLEQHLHEERKRLLALGVASPVLDDAQLVVIALMDEAAVKNRVVRERWKSLQLSFYGHTRAGEEVFRRLNTLRADPTTAPELLELYERCFQWGLQGRYGVGQEQELSTLRDSLKVDIHRRRQSQQQSSPDGIAGGRLVPEPLGMVRIPAQQVLRARWTLLMGVLVLGLVWGGLRLRLSERLNAVSEQVRQTGALVKTAADVAREAR